MVTQPLANSGFDVQKAIYDILTKDTTLATKAGGRIYDAPPKNPALPYVIIGDMLTSPPEMTSSSIRNTYSMDVSVVLGPNPEANVHYLGFETGHAIIDRVFQLLNDCRTLTLKNGRTVQRVKVGQLRTQRVRGQLDTDPDYRVLTVPVEVWVWQAREVSAPDEGGS